MIMNAFLPAVQMSGEDMSWIYTGQNVPSFFEDSSATSIVSSVFTGSSRAIPSQMSFPNVISIGERVFYQTKSLTSIYLPNCTDIGSYAFYSTRLTRLDENNFPKISENLGSYCFAYISTLSYISLSLFNVSYLKYGIFRSCSALQTAILPKQPWRIPSETFANCISLTTLSIASESSGGLILDQSCFYNCGLHSFPFQTFNSVSYVWISASAFRSCPNLSIANFNFTDKISRLQSFAFANCSQLNTVVLNGCSQISGQAFTGCFNLLSLYLLGSSITKLDSVNAFSSTPISTYTTSTGGVNGSIFVPASLYSTYSKSTNWTTYAARFVSLTDAQIAALPF